MGALIAYLSGFLSVCILRDALFVFILRDAVFCASFVMLYFNVCIRRGALLFASFEVLCCVHPSRCLVVCILRGALLCASFETLCCVRMENVSRILRGSVKSCVSMSEVRGKCWKKCLPPFSPMAH